jgi:hypothetical protein
MTIESLIDIDTHMADVVEYAPIQAKTNAKECIIELKKQIKGAIRYYIELDDTVEVPKTMKKILKVLEELSIAQTLDLVLQKTYKVMEAAMRLIKEGVFQRFGAKVLGVTGTVLSSLIQVYRVAKKHSV